MTNSKSYVLIQYKGEKDERARLESGGDKVVFKTGDVQFVQDSRAKHLCGAYQFESVNPTDISPEMLKDAQKRLEKIKADSEKLAKEMAETSKREDAVREKEKEMKDELRALKDKYNSREIDNDTYQEEKEEVKAKWAKVFEGKESKPHQEKEEKVEKEEAPVEPVEEKEEKEEEAPKEEKKKK